MCQTLFWVLTLWSWMRQAISPPSKWLHSSGGWGVIARAWGSSERERERISKQITGCFQITVKGGDRGLLGWMVKEGLIARIALDDKWSQLREICGQGGWAEGTTSTKPSGGSELIVTEERKATNWSTG